MPVPVVGTLDRLIVRRPWVQGLIAGVHRASLPLLRITLGIVFLWFGALKVFDVTPVGPLVVETANGLLAILLPGAVMSESMLIPALGVFEVAIGVALIAGQGMLLAIPLFLGHMLGTFGLLVVMPDVAFTDGNPLLITVEGEFVIKNLVMLAAGLAVGTAALMRRVRGMPAARP